MSVQEEILRIRHEQQGEQALRDAERRYEELKAAARDLDDQLRQGEITEKAHADAINRLGRAVADAGKEMQAFRRFAADDAAMQAQARAAADAEARMKALGAATAAYAATAAPLPAKTNNLAQALAEFAGVTTKAGAASVRAADQLAAIDTGLHRLRDDATKTTQVFAGMGAMLGKGGRFGYGMLQASYIVDDLQYGLSSVVNNVPIFLTSMGVGAGVAGAVSTVAVAANVAVKHLDDLKGLFEHQWQIPRAAIGGAQSLKDELKEVNDELEKMTKKGFLTDGELGRYGMLEARRKQIEKDEQARAAAEEFRKSRPQLLGEAGSAFGSAGAEAGARDIDRAIREAERMRFRNLDPAVIRAEAEREARSKDHPPDDEAEGRVRAIGLVSGPVPAAVAGAFMAPGRDSTVRDFEGAKRRLAERFESMADAAIKGLREGSIEAFEQAVGLLESTYGKDSEVAGRMRQALEKLRARNFVGPSPDEIHRLRLFRDRQDKEREAGAKEAAAGVAQFVGERGSEGVERNSGDILSRQAATAIRGGARPSEALRGATDAAREMLLKEQPALAEMPEQLGAQARALAKRAAEKAAETIEKDAADALSSGYGKGIEEKLRASFGAGKSIDEAMDAVTTDIDAIVKQAAPGIERFPERFRRVTREFADGVRKSFEASVRALEQEGLTPDQARRRIAAQVAEQRQARAGSLASDEFTALAGRMDAENARRDPFARRMGARERREQGEAMRKQFEGLGLSEEEQARAARVLGSHPMAGMMLRQKMGEFAGVAPDERTALMMAIEDMEGGGGQGLTARQANAMQRRQARAFNDAFRQQGRDINEAERIMRRGGLPPGRGYTHPVRNRAADAGPSQDPAQASDKNTASCDRNTEAMNKLTAAVEGGITGLTA